MVGLAQQLFLEKIGKTVQKEVDDCRQEFPKHIEFVDYALAKRLLRDYPSSKEDVVYFLSYLSAAARMGHLCVHVDKHEIYPDPIHCFNDDASLSKEELLAGLVQGSEALPKEMINQSETDQPAPIYRRGNIFYFQRLWDIEQRFITAFQHYLDQPLQLKINTDFIEKRTQDLACSKILLNEQAMAIRKACSQNFTIILGGPGTGKTYTAGYLLKMIWEGLSEEERKNFRISLAAPTGKAASNLEMSIRKALQDTPCSFSVQTLHSLLSIRSSKFKKESTILAADLLIVDESSMIDAQLMYRLMKSLKPGTRLILLGDRHQLPPVESGNFFSDLASRYGNTSRVIELKKCMRAELQEIVDLAEKINLGEGKQVLDMLKESSSNSGLSFQALSEGFDAKSVQQLLIREVLPLLPNPAIIWKEEELMAAWSRLRLLSPVREGVLGFEEINRLLHEALLKKWNKGTSNLFFAPILMTRTDYQLELFNGEIGLLALHNPHHQFCEEGDYALFPAKNENSTGLRRIPAVLLSKYDYAYCLSVHKSQGSEFNHIVLVLPDGSEHFGRELLYTAVTRARKHVEIWSSEAQLLAMIDRKIARLSGLVM